MRAADPAPPVERPPHGDQGSSAIEFALLLPVLVMLLFATIQFGLAFFQWQGLQAAAREGARVAAIARTDQSEIRDRVRDTLPPTISGGAEDCPSPAERRYCVSVEPAADRPCNLRSGEQVAVRVAYRLVVTVPLWGRSVHDLEGTGNFRCE